MHARSCSSYSTFDIEIPDDRSPSVLRYRFAGEQESEQELTEGEVPCRAMVDVLSRRAERVRVRGDVAVAANAVGGQQPGSGRLAVGERGHGGDLDHARVRPEHQVFVADQHRLQQPHAAAATAAAGGVELLVRRELQLLRSGGGGRQRRQARGDDAAAERRRRAAVVLVERRLRLLLLLVVAASDVVEHLHLVQERVVLVDLQRRVRGRRRRHGGRQRDERVAGVVEERRRRRKAGVGVGVGIGVGVGVLRAENRDVPLDVRRVERQARALPALEARVPVVLDLVVRPPWELHACMRPKPKKDDEFFTAGVRGADRRNPSRN